MDMKLAQYPQARNNCNWIDVRMAGGCKFKFINDLDVVIDS